MTEQQINIISEVHNYLDNLSKEYQAELVVLKHEAERSMQTIAHNEECINRIQSSIDTAYMVVSASTVANVTEEAEIESLRSIIKDKEGEIEHLDSKISKIEEEIRKLNSMLNNMRFILGKDV